MWCFFWPSKEHENNANVFTDYAVWIEGNHYWFLSTYPKTLLLEEARTCTCIFNMYVKLDSARLTSGFSFPSSLLHIPVFAPQTSGNDTRYIVHVNVQYMRDCVTSRWPERSRYSEHAQPWSRPVLISNTLWRKTFLRTLRHSGLNTIQELNIIISPRLLPCLFYCTRHDLAATPLTTLALPVIHATSLVYEEWQSPKSNGSKRSVWEVISRECRSKDLMSRVGICLQCWNCL